jgi:hypothetical protein
MKQVGEVFYCIAGSLSSGGSQMALAGQYQLLLAQIKMIKTHYTSSYT